MAARWRLGPHYLPQVAYNGGGQDGGAVHDEMDRCIEGVGAAAAKRALFWGPAVDKVFVVAYGRVTMKANVSDTLDSGEFQLKMSMGGGGGSGAGPGT